MVGSPAHPVPAGPPPATATGGITGFTTHEPVSFPENPFHPSSIPTSADKGCSTCDALLPPHSQGGPGLFAGIFFITIHPATGKARAPISLCPTYRPQAIHSGLQIGSAPNYGFCSPTSGSPGKGTGYDIIIPRNKGRPQEDSSDPGSGIRTSEGAQSCPYRWGRWSAER